MPISQSDQLFNLVKSLTKAEKRNFTFYSTRIQDADSLKYIQLFDLLDKQKVLDENQILTKLKDVDKTQYSNLKRHLYKQLMVSLRMIHIQKKTDIQVREYLDYVDILYGKGLYIQSLKILDKAKALAEKSNNDLLSLAILETEKNIESRHITRSGTDMVPDLIEKSVAKIKTIEGVTKLSNIRILLHSHYIKNGHVKNQEELDAFTAEYAWVRDYNQDTTLSYYEKIYLYQSLVWYYYIVLDFEEVSGVTHIAPHCAIGPPQDIGMRAHVEVHQPGNVRDDVLGITQGTQPLPRHARPDDLVVVEGHPAVFEAASVRLPDVVQQGGKSQGQLRRALLDDGDGVSKHVLVLMHGVLRQGQRGELG